MIRPVFNLINVCISCLEEGSDFMLPHSPRLEGCGDCTIAEFEKSLLWVIQSIFAGLLYTGEKFTSSGCGGW